ncbi:MAG: transglutaminase domain-containing protein [Chloroflexi bacterium]|nr:transglutaminase domain-containing protein [Chloroflexota bacterium]
MHRKRRFLIFLTYVTTLVLLIASGLSCSSGVAARDVSAANGLPKTESEFKSYITPRCPQVVGTLRSILGDPPYEISQTGFDDIRTWVANEIDYISDEKRLGGDHWQTPEETLRLGTGDCEDFSILLCSLLRAYGIDAERVYVAIGINDEKDEHAFLIEDWNCDGEWRRIEPQAPAQTPSSYPLLSFLMSHPDSRLDKYKITAAFNDLYYHNDEPFSRSEGQANVWTLAKTISTVGNTVQRLIRLARYLLGLVFS